MTYVISDMHGEYEAYIAMLEKIGFSDEDTLYVLGDVVDRGARPVDILLDMMCRPNVFPILSNHELMALDMLRSLTVEITEETLETHLNAELMKKLLEWQMDGGDTTMKQFQKLPYDTRAYVLEYLEEFALCEIAEVGERTFLLVHAGLGNFSPDKELDDYTPQELTCMRPDYDRRYFGDRSFFIVSGHTPTLAVSGKAEIYQSQNNILIDCGATFGGRLACLCLDTMEAYYVSSAESKR